MIESSERPWGKWIKTDEGEGFWVKKIEVNPYHRLSLQKHANRAEVWTIVQGYGEVTINDNIFDAWVGRTYHIHIGDIHRIHNRGPIPLIFIEVAYGQPLETDIIRVQDDYGREGTSNG